MAAAHRALSQAVSEAGPSIAAGSSMGDASAAGSEERKGSVCAPIPIVNRVGRRIDAHLDEVIPAERCAASIRFHRRSRSRSSTTVRR